MYKESITDGLAKDFLQLMLESDKYGIELADSGRIIEPSVQGISGNELAEAVIDFYMESKLEPLAYSKNMLKAMYNKKIVYIVMDYEELKTIWRNIYEIDNLNKRQAI